MLNRKLKRTLEKKLGADFPLDEFIALAGFYSKHSDMDFNEFTVFALKYAVPLMYDEIDALGGFNENEGVEDNEDI